MSLALPAVGFGTAPQAGLRPVELEPAIDAAFEAGCRLFDTAEVYGTESLLAARLARAGADRPPVVTKLWQTNHAPAHVGEACRGSLRRLGLDAIDLYLVHAPASWPYLGPLEVDPGWRAEEIASRVVPAAEEVAAHAAVPLAETWAAMLDLRRQGLVREVGLANVESAEIAALVASGLEPPAAVEIEVNPLRPRRELVDWCGERGIRVLAYSPFAGGRALADARVVAAARGAGSSPARLVLDWLAARGVVPLPGSRRPEHVVMDLAPTGVAPPTSALAALDALAGGADEAGAGPG